VSVKIACPGTDLFHDAGDPQNFLVKPAARETHFTCLVCNVRWSMSAAQVRRLVVRAEIGAAWSAESDA
jgi:hypothetical protein